MDRKQQVRQAFLERLKKAKKQDVKKGKGSLARKQEVEDEDDDDE